MKTIIVTDHALNFLEVAAQDELLQAAVELEAMSIQTHPDKFPKATARFQSGVIALHAIWLAQDTKPAELPYTAGELQGMRDVGLDPEKELGGFDPRAWSPQCIHGHSLSEDCTLCADSNERNTPLDGSA